MLLEISLYPLGDSRTGDELAEAIDIIAESGLPYRVGPSATCIEGGWDEVMAVARACHEAISRRSPHHVTLLKIEEDGGERDLLERNVAAVVQRRVLPAGPREDGIPVVGD